MSVSRNSDVFQAWYEVPSRGIGAAGVLVLHMWAGVEADPELDTEKDNQPGESGMEAGMTTGLEPASGADSGLDTTPGWVADTKVGSHGGMNLDVVVGTEFAVIAGMKPGSLAGMRTPGLVDDMMTGRK